MSCLQLHADEANWVNAMQNFFYLCVKTTDYCKNIQVIFGLEVVKENNHTLQVVKNLISLSYSSKSNDLLHSKTRFVMLEIESLIL